MDSIKTPNPIGNLGAEQTKLLYRIKQVIGTTGLDQDTNRLLEDNIVRFNALQYTQESSGSLNGCDPLDRLPRELWEDVIHGSVATESNGSLKWDVDKLLYLTCVSKKWQENILWTPSFWRNISIDNRTEDLEFKLTLCIHLSGNSPLNVVIEVPISGWNTLGPLIAPQGFRIRSIVLHRNNYAAYMEVQKHIDLILTTFGNLPSLNELICRLGDYPAVDTALRRANSVERLDGILVSPDTLTLQSVKNLRYLQTCTPHEKIIHRLAAFKSLDSVAFFINVRPLGLPVGAELNPGTHTEPLPWTSLHIGQGPVFSMESFYTRLSNTLQCLSTIVYWNNLAGLLLACSQMHELDTLRLTISRGSGTYEHLPTINPLHRIHSLELTENMAMNVERDENIRQVFKTLTLCVTQVRSLDVAIYDKKMQAGLYAESLPQLETFKYAPRGLEKPTTGLITLPTVEDVQFSPLEPLISLIHCPRAVIFSGIDGTSPIKSTRLHLNRWSTLRSINITSNQIKWTDVSLPLVERITFKWSQGGATPLLGELAQKPAAFPSLKYVGMSEFPEWDILFLALERRNFLFDSGISPIGTVAFPRFPAPNILRPLIYRLRGHLSERPSNYDLSLMSIKDMFFDKKVSGCRSCHLGLMFCNEKVQKYTHWGYLYENTKDLEIPSYPTNAAEVIASWPTRAKWWKQQYEQSRINRIEDCKHVMGQSLTEITGYIQAD